MFKKDKQETSAQNAQGLEHEEKKLAENQSEAAKNEGLRELIEKNIKWSQVVYQQNKKINNRLTLMVIGSYLRLVLVLAPIIFAIFYLPPFIKELMNKYGSMLPINSVNTSGIVEEFSNLLLQKNIEGGKINQIR